MFFVFRNNHNAKHINKCGYKLVCNTSSTASGPPSPSGEGISAASLPTGEGNIICQRQTSFLARGKVANKVIVQCFGDKIF